MLVIFKRLYWAECLCLKFRLDPILWLECYVIICGQCISMQRWTSCKWFVTNHRSWTCSGLCLKEAFQLLTRNSPQIFNKLNEAFTTCKHIFPSVNISITYNSYLHISMLLIIFLDLYLYYILYQHLSLKR